MRVGPTRLAEGEEAVELLDGVDDLEGGLDLFLQHDVHRRLLQLDEQRDELDDADVAVGDVRQIAALQHAPRADRVLEVDADGFNLLEHPHAPRRLVGEHRHHLYGGIVRCGIWVPRDVGRLVRMRMGINVGITLVMFSIDSRSSFV